MTAIRTSLRSLERTKLYDLIAAAPLIVYYAMISQSMGGRLVDQLAAELAAPNLHGEILLSNMVLKFLFVTLLICLLVLRRVPIGKVSGLIPRGAAVAGAYSGMLVTSLPVAPGLSWGILYLTMIPITIGLVGALYSLWFLGRQFSIMPEARRLVTNGPYALVRHPLYLFEITAFLGMMLQHVQPWAAISAAATVTLIFVRMTYEEDVMAGTFPEYRAYAGRTRRLIPGVY